MIMLNAIDVKSFYQKRYRSEAEFVKFSSWMDMSVEGKTFIIMGINK
jgi:hypothetical protein